MKRTVTLIALMLFLTLQVVGQCDIIYVTPLGLPSGVGSMNDPMDISTAFTTAPSGSHIRMAVGTYTVNNSLSLNGQNIVVEGGFIDTLSWTKTSLAGATTIFRSNLNPAGPANAPRISALELVNLNGFRFQDVTIQTDNAPAATQVQPYGVTVYGVYMDSCAAYSWVRCQIISGNGGAGLNGSAGSNGVNGTNGSQGSAGSCDGNYTCCFGSESAPGGNGGQGGQGGAGVAGGASNNSTTNNNPGTTGTGRNGGGGGAGGKGGGFNGGGSSAVAGSAGGGSASAGLNSTVGQPGAQGDPGGDGTTGTAGIAGVAGALGAQGTAGLVTSGFWIPGAQAPNGGDGTGGQGGSGGGGGGRQTCAVCNDGPGNGGAGGGGGGQGGQGGQGGYGGGSSFAVFINFNGQGGTMIDCFVQAGNQGNGGIGGNGGAGGNGGSGGIMQSNCSSEIGEGGPGGAGGAGGVGGKGGDGANGISQNVYFGTGDTLTAQQDTFDLQAQPEIQVSYVMCSNATMQAQAIGGNSVQWTINTPSAAITSATNPTSFSNGAVGYTTLNAQVDTLGNQTYTDFIYISCNGETVEQDQTICQGEEVLFNGNYYSQAGDYTDTLLNAQGCDSIVILHLVVQQINNTVSTNPSNGQQLVSSNTVGLSYQWINCTTGANLPGANGSSLLVSQNGTYAVVSTNANGCADTSNCVTIDNIGLDEVATFHFNVVPNPFVNEISIAFDKDFTGTMNITDLGGKVVYSTAIDHQQQVTAVLSLSKGMYLIQVQDETGSKTLRVLKV